MTSLSTQLDSLLIECTTVTQVAVVASDGLLRGAAGPLSGDRGAMDSLAAVTSATASLGMSMAELLGHHHRSAVYEHDGGYVMIIAAGNNSHLVATAEGDAVDIGQLGYEATTLVNKIGTSLGVPPRALAPAASSGPDLAPEPER
jgi:predicted regulator of Ras-like GTPase activity (Roadblock/LC7/MglB family)